MGFGDSVRTSVKKVNNQINDKVVEMATDYFKTVVGLTPVSDASQKKRGELINNWHLSTNGSPNKTYTSNFDITGGGSLQRINTLKSSKEFLGKDGKVSITNIVSYGYRAEYAGWPSPRWNNTAPYAMMRNARTIVSAKYKI